MGSLQLVLCVFLGCFFFGFHRSLRGNGGAFCAEYLVIHVVNVNFTHSLTMYVRPAHFDSPYVDQLTQPTASQAV